MPVAVVIAPDTNLAIIEAMDETELFRRLCALDQTPETARESEAAMRRWIEQLPAPPGWFANTGQAKAFGERTLRERHAQLMKAAMKETGFSQREMTVALGLADPHKDGSAVRKILLAKSGISGPLRRTLAYVVDTIRQRRVPLTQGHEDEILGALNEGHWRIVHRTAIHRA